MSQSLRYPLNANIRLGWLLIGLEWLAAIFVEPEYFRRESLDEAQAFLPFVVSIRAGIFVGLFLIALGASQAVRAKRGDMRSFPFVLGAPATLLMIIATVLMRTGTAVMVAHTLLVLTSGLLLIAAIRTGLTVEGERTRIIKLSYLLASLGLFVELMLQLLSIYPPLGAIITGDSGDLDHRMLRLGLAAALTVPVLTILLRSLPVLSAPADAEGVDSGQTRPSTRFVEVSGIASVTATGLFVMLAYFASSRGTAPNALSHALNGLAGLGALSVVIWSLAGTVEAIRRGARPVEVVGWATLAACTMLGIPMFLYAFLGIVPEQLSFLTEFFDLERRYIRIFHIHGIYFAMFMIGAARQLGPDRSKGMGTAMLLIGAFLVSEISLVLSSFDIVSPSALFLGPLLTALAMFSLAMLASTHNLQSILSQTRTPAVTT